MFASQANHEAQVEFQVASVVSGNQDETLRGVGKAPLKLREVSTNLGEYDSWCTRYVGGGRSVYCFRGRIGRRQRVVKTHEK